MKGGIKSFLISAFLVALALMLLSPLTDRFAPQLVSPYLNQIGEAVLVGMVVSLAVDRYLKADLLAEIARDVLRFTVGYELPDQIRDEVRHLLRLPIVRREFEMTFDMTPDTAHPHIMNVEMRTRFTVDNLSKRPHEYTFASSIQRSPLPDIAESSIECVKMTGQGGFTLTGVELRKQLTCDDHFHRFAKRVTLPSKENVQREFSTVRKTIFPARDVYVLDILEPTIDIRINIRLPDNFKCSVYFPVQGETERTEADGIITHTHKGVFLPGQFVRISWEPKQSQPTLA